MRPQGADILAAEAIGDEAALAPGLDKACLPEHLEVGAGQFDVDVRLCCQDLHGLLALGEDLQEFKTLRAGGGLADPGDLFVEKVFEFALVHISYILTIFRTYHASQPTIEYVDRPEWRTAVLINQADTQAIKSS